MSAADGYLARLDGVEARLAGLAEASPPPDALTGADPSTGERWDRGQVWAHLAEFIPYWIAQARPILDTPSSSEPVRFGRTKSDPERIGAIERDRREPVTVLWSDTRYDIRKLRGFLTGLEPEQWNAIGLHPTLGPMSMSAIVEEFLVGHLEQHAAQLEALATA
jgi:hypothetical protein